MTGMTAAAEHRGPDVGVAVVLVQDVEALAVLAFARHRLHGAHAGDVLGERAVEGAQLDARLHERFARVLRPPHHDEDERRHDGEA